MHWMDHLLIVPIVLPLAAGAFLLFLDERRRALKAAISIASTLALLVVAILLLEFASAQSPDAPALAGVYRLGNWPAPFGIVLVVDRLSALMVTLTSVLALASLVFSLARWHRAGTHFHSLFLFLLVGLNGAFLTGDLFNLFVFFELLLVASYGLVLHGSGIRRVKAALPYIVVNLAASLLFLIGVSLIYGATGTLNMADLATRIPQVAAHNRTLLEAGAAILGIAFLTKAGMWPLGFWLPSTYSAAVAPVAAIFSIMTKVGVYVVLRLWLLLFGSASGALAHFGREWLLVGGLATVAFGIIGMLASKSLARRASHAVLISSGTVLAAIAMGHASVTGTALFYLVSSTLALCAFFMLIELAERGRQPEADAAESKGASPAESDEETMAETGKTGFAIPATMVVLEISFLGCALLLAGLPPLSGFVAKFALLTALLNSPGPGAAGAISPASWALLVLVIGAGLATIIGLTQAGIRAFWQPQDRAVPRVRFIEIVPVGVLLLVCAILTIQAGPVMNYMQSTAQSIHEPSNYVHGVLTTSHGQSPADKGDS